MTDLSNNPLVNTPKLPFGAIPFNLIKLEHYLPAIEDGIKKTKVNIEKIKNCPDLPSFENTIVALETAQNSIEKPTKIYFNLMSCESNDEFKSLAQKISPMLAQISSEITMDPILFKRVKTVYSNIETLKLNSEERRLLETTYKSYVRNGALLDDKMKKELQEIDVKASKLGPVFGQNLLNETNAFELHITEENDLDGLPEVAKSAARETAKKKGKEGWILSLQMPSYLPAVKYLKKRSLRKVLVDAMGARSFGGKFDNSEILKTIAVLRYKRAKILGYNTHADFILEERMAKNPNTVSEFLENLLKMALPVAKKEINDLKEFAFKIDNLKDFYSWDSAYYSEKLKKKLFNYESEELRPYFKIENVVNGIFQIANKLYDLTFEEIDNLPVYQKDVKVYKVTDKHNEFIGLLYMDLFPRETKRGGAWMTTFRGQGLENDEIVRPHVSVVANLTKPTDNHPALLDLNEVTTIFHEFGHALHALLSDCQFQSLASPNVYWDFVELPSQIMENWATEYEALILFANHYQTGEVIPKELIAKVKKSETFHKGMQNIGQLSYAFIDMGWHAIDPTQIKDIKKFEDDTIGRLRLLPQIEKKSISCAFSHIFAGGYAAGYYSYKWAEVLDADAFDEFKINGIFNKETATSFKENILSKGNSAHPMELYKKFKGKEPDPNALFKRDGLI